MCAAQVHHLGAVGHCLQGVNKRGDHHRPRLLVDDAGQAVGVVVAEVGLDGVGVLGLGEVAGVIVGVYRLHMSAP